MAPASMQKCPPYLDLGAPKRGSAHDSIAEIRICDLISTPGAVAIRLHRVCACCSSTNQRAMDLRARSLSQCELGRTI